MNTKLLVDPVHNIVLNFENQPINVSEMIGGLFQIGVFYQENIDSQIAIDFRKLLAYPRILNQVAELMWEKLVEVEYQHILGIPVSGAVIASGISMKRMVPMIVEYKGRLEGDYFAGQRVALLSPFINTGESVLELATLAKKEGLIVTDVVTFLDGRMDGHNPFVEHGIQVQSVISFLDIFIFQSEFPPSFVD